MHEITKGRMKGKLTRGRRIQILHDLANDDGYVALKRAAEGREGCQKPAVQQKTVVVDAIYSIV